MGPESSISGNRLIQINWGRQVRPAMSHQSKDSHTGYILRSSKRNTRSQTIRVSVFVLILQLFITYTFLALNWLAHTLFRNTGLTDFPFCVRVYYSGLCRLAYKRLWFLAVSRHNEPLFSILKAKKIKLRRGHDIKNTLSGIFTNPGNTPIKHLWGDGSFRSGSNQTCHLLLFCIHSRRAHPHRHKTLFSQIAAKAIKLTRGDWEMWEASMICILCD